MIDRTNNGKFLVDGAVLTDLLQTSQKGLENFEVEFKPDAKKLIPGTEIKMNYEMDPKDITDK